MSINKIEELIQRELEAGNITADDLEALACQGGHDDSAGGQDLLNADVPMYSPEELAQYQAFLQGSRSYEQDQHPTDIELETDERPSIQQIKEILEATQEFNGDINQALGYPTDVDVNIQKAEEHTGAIFDSRLKDEIEKRVELQSKNAELEAMVRYQQSLLDKQGEKSLGLIDEKQALEAELRRARSAMIPDELSSFVQDYLLFQEQKTPLHKYKFINSALKFFQDKTGVSGDDYLRKIYEAEYADIPTPDSFAVSKLDLPDKKDFGAIISF